MIYKEEHIPMPPKTIQELHIPSILGHEKVAMEAAASLAQEMGLSASRIDDLRTAVSEACLNAIEHGNQQNANTQVAITLTQGTSSLQVDIDDQGPGQKTIPQHRPSLHKKLAGEEQSRGWGMFLIQSLVDEVHLDQTPEGHNRTRLIIHI